MVPFIDLALQFVAALEEARIGGCVFGDKPGKAGSELLCCNRQSGERFPFNEIDQQGMNRKAGFREVLAHSCFLYVQAEQT